jgi:hypothetical protein
LTGARAARFLQSHLRLGTHLIETFDALGLAAFVVVGVVVVLDTSAEPLWLWRPISAGITSSFGSLVRDLLRPDREAASLKGEDQVDFDADSPAYAIPASICGQRPHAKASGERRGTREPAEYRLPSPRFWQNDREPHLC